MAVVDDRIRRVVGEEHRARLRPGGDERLQTQPQRRVGHGQRVAQCQSRRHPDRATGRERGQENDGTRRVALRVPLREKPAHRVPDEHRRLREPLGRPLDVLQVVVDAVPDALAGLVVPTQPDGADVVATLGEAGGEPVPAPWAVPGAVDEQDPGHGLERARRRVVGRTGT